MIITRRYIVTGVVQGVWFRKYIADAANRLGLSGWIRNMNDGQSVEALAAGTEQQLSELESAIWIGSPSSRVDSVQIEDSTDTVDDGFKAR